MRPGRTSLLAFDLGAESGRAMLGHFQEGMLRLQEIHRFYNGPVKVRGNIHWDVLHLWQEVQQGLRLAAKTCAEGLQSVGVDTWGVDFGLLSADGSLIGNPYHYRDSRTDGILEWTFQRLPGSEIYQATGIQFMQFNSLFQLMAMVKDNSPELEIADRFLTMPDLFHYWLTGRKANEFTNATTTQCYDPFQRDWSWGMLEKLGIPTHLFGEIVQPGTVLGELLNEVATECGCRQVPVIVPASHDTGSAVAAVPADVSDYIYISSGTWSLMGVETSQPIISSTSLEYNFTNEGGVNDTIRFLKNIMGLWLVQECRREWARAGSSYSYDELTAMASTAPAFTALIDVSDPRFLHPSDMVACLQGYCRETGQAVPTTPADIIRCSLESLALEYRWAAERLETILQRPLPVIHIIGGGSQNRLLNQFTANATRRQVFAGPVEATAIGNLLVQSLGLGLLSSLSEGREIVRSSFDVTSYQPEDDQAWDAAYQTYKQLKKR